MEFSCEAKGRPTRHRWNIHPAQPVREVILGISNTNVESQYATAEGRRVPPARLPDWTPHRGGLPQSAACQSESTVDLLQPLRSPRLELYAQPPGAPRPPRRPDSGKPRTPRSGRRRNLPQHEASVPCSSALPSSLVLRVGKLQVRIPRSTMTAPKFRPQQHLRRVMLSEVSLSCAHAALRQFLQH